MQRPCQSATYFGESATFDANRQWPTLSGVLVAFKAQTLLTERVAWNFHHKIKNNPDPFRKLSAIGGTNKWFFEGILEMRPLKQKKRICDEIAAALVTKIEEQSFVGVERIDFEALDPEVLL